MSQIELSALKFCKNIHFGDFQSENQFWYVQEVLLKDNENDTKYKIELK